MLLSEEPPSTTAVSSAFFNFNAFCFISTASGPTVASDNILASDLKTCSLNFINKRLYIICRRNLYNFEW
uniref:Uncharacterized protein n=1 Tax=Populus trichocarpa TaxID=3694 RepID=A0A2K1Z5E1_POPTR